MIRISSQIIVPSTTTMNTGQNPTKTLANPDAPGRNGRFVQLPDLQPDGRETQHQGHQPRRPRQALLWPALIRCSPAVCTSALTTISTMTAVPDPDLRVP